MRFFLFVAVLALASGCAASPQLYPNEKLKSVGRDAADKDIEACEKLADDYMTSGKGKEIASGAGRGAAVGAVTGGVFGIFSHNILGGAVVGGAVGGAAGGAGAAVSPDQVKRNFINHCLEERGYKVMGWK
jgi:hypothetical protein